MDGGYSFFGPLIEFPRGCERCRLLRDGVLHFARGFRDDVDPANIRLECSSLTREVSGFPSEISFEFTDMPEMSSIAIQVNDWACRFPPPSDR